MRVLRTANPQFLVFLQELDTVRKGSENGEKSGQGYSKLIADNDLGARYLYQGRSLMKRRCADFIKSLG